MDELEKARTQEDARKAVASRKSAGTGRYGGLLRYLGAELYHERRVSERAEKPPEREPK